MRISDWSSACALPISTATPRRRSTRLKARTSTPYWISRPRIWRWRASTRPSPTGILKHAAADLPLAQAKKTFMAIIKTERHGAIAVMMLDRPETMNALGALGVGDAIAEECAEINAEPAARRNRDRVGLEQSGSGGEVFGDRRKLNKE